MTQLDLDREIERVIAKLSTGSDPRQVLTDFAVTVRSSEGQTVSIERVHACLDCGEADVRCPVCYARHLAQEKVIPAAMAKLAQFSFGRHDEDIQSEG